MPKNSQKGFTLVEITLVISILFILAAMAVPKINNFIADRELDGAAKMLAADIRLLQQMTINANGFDGEVSFPLLNLNNGAVPCSYNISQSTRVLKKVTLPDSVLMSYSYRTISFDVNGLPGQGYQGYTITFTSPKLNGKNKYVIVAGATGRVRVSDVYDVD